MSATIRRISGVLLGAALITGILLPARLPRVQVVGCYTGIHPTPPDAIEKRRQTGLDRRVYRGIRFDELVSWGPDLACITNFKSLPIPGQQDHFSVRWNGYLRVQEPGTYGLKCVNDDGAIVRMDGQAILSNWGCHDIIQRETKLYLARGDHPIQIDYFQYANFYDFRLEWRPPGKGWTVLTSPHFVRDPTRAPGGAEPSPVTTRALDPAWIDAHALSPGLVATWIRRPTDTEELPSFDIPDRWPADSDQSSSAFDPNHIDVIRCLVPELPGGKIPLSIPPENQIHSFQVSWDGFVLVPAGGEYRFQVSSDDGARLRIDNRDVVTNWRLQDTTVKETTLSLSAGWHSFRLDYFNGRGKADLGVTWAPPGSGFVPIHPRLLAHANAIEPRRSWTPSLSFCLPDLSLEREANVVAPVFNRWSARKLGPPQHRPVPLLTYTAVLKVPVAGRYTFWLDSAGRSTLWINGRWITTGWTGGPVPLTVYLAAGQPQVRIDYASPGGGDRLSLEWESDQFPRRPVAQSDLILTNWWYWVGLSLALLLLTGVLWWTNPVTGEPAHLATRACLLTVVLLGALFIRLERYELLPVPGETDDEFTSHTHGPSVLSGGPPFSWDRVRTFRKRVVIELYGRIFPIVIPHLHYPPVFEITVAAFLRLAGQEPALDIQLHVSRLVPILLSVLSVWLLFRAAQLMGFSFFSSWLAAAIFATVPVAVLSSHLVKQESLMTALFLASLTTAIDYDRRHRYLDLVVHLLCIPFCILTKATGLALVPTFILFFCRKRLYGAAFLVLLTGTLSEAAWIAWGWHWIGHGILDFLAEANRLYRTHLGAMAVLFVGGRITDLPFAEPLWIGLMGLGIAGLCRRRAWPALWLMGFYLVALTAVFDPLHRQLGWYRTPFIPFLCLGVALLVEGAITRADPVRAFVIAGLLVAPLVGQVLGPKVNEARQILQGILVVSGLPFSLAWLFPYFRRGLCRLGGFLLVLALLVSFLGLDFTVDQHYPKIDFIPDPVPWTGFE